MAILKFDTYCPCTNHCLAMGKWSLLQLLHLKCPPACEAFYQRRATISYTGQMFASSACGGSLCRSVPLRGHLLQIFLVGMQRSPVAGGRLCRN